MRTILPYRTFPDSFGTHMYWAVLRIQVALPAPNAPRTKRFEAIIDSGATRCLFHASLASYLGLNLKSGVCEITNGIGGQEEVWLHDVSLFVPGGPVKIKAGFKERCLSAVCSVRTGSLIISISPLRPSRSSVF